MSAFDGGHFVRHHQIRKIVGLTILDSPAMDKIYEYIIFLFSFAGLLFESFKNRRLKDYDDLPLVLDADGMTTEITMDSLIYTSVSSSGGGMDGGNGWMCYLYSAWLQISSTAFHK